MPKRKFDRALLDETLARDNASHDETKELPTRLNRDSRIPFTCACGTPHTKGFREIVEKGGARCKLCTEREKQVKKTANFIENYGVAHVSHINGQAFNRELLDATLARDDAILDETEELPIPLNRDSLIPFTCVCGTSHTKVFRELVRNGGARCKLCTEREKRLKMEATMLEKHGVTHYSHINGQAFDRELLDATLARDDAILDETEELPIPLNCESLIPFKCACGAHHTKIFNVIVNKGGARCEPCTEREKQLKFKSTLLGHHGVSNPAHIHGQVFNRELLDATLARDNARLDETELPDDINVYTRIAFICECETPHTKAFRELVESGGARCEPCTERERRLKTKATCIEKFDCENPFQSAVVKEKMKATNLEKYGVANPMQSVEVKDKVKATMLENHGVENAMHSAVFREKVQATCLENHGVKNPMQCAEILEQQQKNAFKRKDFTTPSGQVWTLQGYEPLVAPKLIDEYGEDDITPDLKQVPCVWWTDSKGVRHKYYCDFYVKSRKLVIEVKGPWTETKDAEKIVATREAANALGYGYRLIVLDDKGVWTRDEFSPSILGAEGKKPLKE